MSLQILYTVENFKNKDKSNETVLLYGRGDGGGKVQLLLLSCEVIDWLVLVGGPRPDMLERLVRFKDLDGMPKIDMSTPFEYFKKVKSTSDDIPTWVGELVRISFHERRILISLFSTLSYIKARTPLKPRTNCTTERTSFCSATLKFLQRLPTSKNTRNILQKNLTIYGNSCYWINSTTSFQAHLLVPCTLTRTNTMLKWSRRARLCWNRPWPHWPLRPVSLKPLQSLWSAMPMLLRWSTRLLGPDKKSLNCLTASLNTPSKPPTITSH